ncbi:MAG: thioredoxin [Candidatus Dojkabacteria bacterium]|nr:thioredoxin [Candidatus Dojkabacteria bacterium]
MTHEQELQQLNSNNFKSEVIDYKGLVLVDFWAEWCGPCQKLSPILKQISKKFRDKIKFCQLNVEEAPEIAITYNIMSIPTLIMFRNGGIIETIIGLQPEHVLTAKLQQIIDSHDAPSSNKQKLILKPSDNIEDEKQVSRSTT